MLAGTGYIGTLKIEKLALELPVLSVCSEENMQKGPCRYAGDSCDNLIIAAHNFDSQFGRLGTLAEGDEILFTDTEGTTFTYTLVRTEQLEPTDIQKMTENNPALTLFTCTPGGRNRLALRFTLCEEAPA